MSVVILLDVVHAVAPDYTLRRHHCYCFSPVFLVVRPRTGGNESHREKIKHLGKLYFLSLGHAADNDKAVTEEEYEKGWEGFNVGDLSVPPNGWLISRIQAHEIGRLLDLERVRKAAEDRADKLAKEGEITKENEEIARKNEDAGRRQRKR